MELTTEVYVRGPARFDMCGQSLPTQVHLTDEVISRGLAQRLSAEAVSHYRKRRSIPATVLRGSFPKEAIPDLGTASDAEIAQRHGVSETTVWRKRKLHGVPSYSPREL